MKLRILLAASPVEDTFFLQDVLTELDGREYWSDWVHLETVPASSWEEAEAILKATEGPPVDLILLDWSLPIWNPPASSAPDLWRRDPHQNAMDGAEAFLRAQALAPQVPVVLLVGSEDIARAELLLREGAQDYLVKSQVDCEPLAHAMRNAIERHRYLESARSAAMTDPLTGLLNRAAFLALAERDRKMAFALNRRILVAVGESDAPPDRAQKQQDQEMALVEAAERLRRLAGPLDLVARVGERCFALAFCETTERTLEDAWARLTGASASLKLNFGSSIFRPGSPATIEDLMEQAQHELAPLVAAARR